MTEPEPPTAPTVTVIPAHLASLGVATVRRVLPTRARRTIGAWCFVDHFGPSTADAPTDMAIGPHPHTGLQTVTWLVDGAMHHLDSLGSSQALRAGELNLMTAGHGISHAEVMPTSDDDDDDDTGSLGGLHGLQMWLALPDPLRSMDPAFEHHADLPVVELAGWRATIVVGAYLDRTSPASVHTPLLGVELVGDGPLDLDLDPSFEHGCYVLTGSVTVADERVDAGQLAYIERGTPSISLAAAGPSRVMLLGGEPFPDPIHMWWNFVAGTRAEIDVAVEQWNAGGRTRFGHVEGSGLPRIASPRPPWRTAAS